MDEKLRYSREIYDKAIADFKPESVVCMISGGDDSLTAYHVARAIGAKIDFVMHVNTRTGIPQTNQFVRDTFVDENYIEADAGSAYEDYVLRKGFMGRGYKNHAQAFHLLKAGPYRKAISKHIRQGRRNFPVLLLNGARESESDNRTVNAKGIYNRDSSAKNNIWTNIIQHWSRQDCKSFLDERKACRNPVAKELCRSGECMCGTMQSDEDRIEASLLYPEWGKWLDNLGEEVVEDYPWKWGREQPGWFKQLKHGQMGLMGEHEEYEHQFQPMCVGCKENN